MSLSLISPERSNLLPSVGGGPTVRAIERKVGLECKRKARLGPSGVGRPRVVGWREGGGGPGSRTRARIEGRGAAKHVGPSLGAISQSPYAPWSRQILTARVGGEGCRGPRRWRAEA